MRIAYLDEAGITARKQEPYAVVAGVIVHGDSQIKPLENALAKVVAEFPAAHLNERFIHTAKIYGGYGPFHKSKGWTEAMRFSLLDQISSLFSQLQLHVVFGICDKAKLNPRIVHDHRDENQAAHVTAAANCTLQIERYMREYCPDELAWIVMENTAENSRALKAMHRFFANVPPELAAQYDNRWTPLTKIRGTPQFEEKGDESILQIADYCAFVTKRQMMRDPFIERYFGPIRMWFSYGRSDDPDHPLHDPWSGPTY